MLNIGITGYDATVSFQPATLSGTVISCTGDSFLGLITTYIPNRYYEITHGTITYISSGDLWRFVGYDADGEKIGQFQVYQADYESAGWTFTGTPQNNDAVLFSCEFVSKLAGYIKNLALTELNHETISDWSDTTNTDIELINTQYSLAKPIALSMYQWSWAFKYKELTGSVNTGTLSKYKTVMTLPSDFIGYLAAYTDNNMRILADYLTVGDKVYTNSDKLYIKYIASVDESLFTPEFIDWFKIFLAQRLNGYLNGDMQRQQLLNGEEPFFFRKAKNIDSKRNKHESLDGNPLLWIRGKNGGGIR